ncbi:MAG: hypothetical protein HY735_26600 [Verrucomicrobia bacterium]|nr:hypothetical protein [Verrucomicrobiota bacterium]
MKIVAPFSRAPHGWIGAILVSTFWPLNWFLPGLRTAYLFFPLWLGYILVVDALVLGRRGTSLYTRSRTAFWALFAASAPAWWLFEVINWRTKNWEYLGGEHFSGFEYFLLSSLSFSTVMPAVFESAELVRSFRWIERLGPGPKLNPTSGVRLKLLAGGLAMLGLTMAWPEYCYPLVWGAVFLILEPLNVLLGRQNFLEWLQDGDWRPVVSLSLAALICGIFWEMWNFYSFPKWIYHTPGAEFLHIFEMPLLGYIGYLPFAWELFSLRNFLWPLAPRLRI